MIVDLEPQPFLQKLAEVAATATAPVRVEVIRKSVPVFVAVGGRSRQENAILVIYQFRDGSDEYLAREHAFFDEHGDADLGALVVWPQLRRLGVSGAPAANDVPPPEALRNVRPVVVHRSGSV